MKSLKEGLFNYDYWNSTRKELFDITNYDRTLCEKGVVTKQVAHNCLISDCKRLITWTNDSNMEKALKQLLNKVPFSKKNATNLYFWDNTAPALAKQQLDNIVFEGAISSTTRQIIAQTYKNLLYQSESSSLKRPSTSEESASSSTEKPELVKKMRSKGESIEGKKIEEENDGIFVSGSSWSVATIIKQKALLLHEKYKKDHKLTDSEFAVMSMGLSSIMDFSNECDGSQKTLFVQENWLELRDHYNNKYRTQLVSLPSIVTDTWIIVTNVIINNRDVQAGLLYLYKVYPKHMTKPYFYCFKIFEHVLDLVENYSDMLTKGNSASENDHIRIVWSTIFEQLFRPKTNVKVTT